MRCTSGWDCCVVLDEAPDDSPIAVGQQTVGLALNPVRAVGACTVEPANHPGRQMIAAFAAPADTDGRWVTMLWACIVTPRGEKAADRLREAVPEGVDAAVHNDVMPSAAPVTPTIRDGTTCADVLGLPRDRAEAGVPARSGTDALPRRRSRTCGLRREPSRLMPAWWARDAPTPADADPDDRDAR